MSSADNVIADIVTGQRGTISRGKLEVGRRASGAEIAIPYVVVAGAQDGPVLWINGQVHGNEVAAIVAALDFCNGIDLAQLKGTVVFTATGNPLALDTRTMFSPQDWANLDQSFPGRPEGFITERLAYCLFREILSVRPDLLISMHAQGTEAASKLYGVFKQPPECSVSKEYLLPFLRLFDPFVVCHMRVEPGGGEIPGNHAGALDYQAMAAGIPAFMIELGTGQRAAPADVVFGIQAFTRVACRMKMLEGEDYAGDAATLLVTARGHVMTDDGGLFRPAAAPGEIVPAGKPLGTVMDLTGNPMRDVVQDHDVLIISIRIDPVVHGGDNVAYVAHAWTPKEY